MNLAQRLEALFTQTATPGGRPKTLQEVVDLMEEGGIATMSVSYLAQLRSGQATNPRLQHLKALAKAFGVPLTYLTDDYDEEVMNSEVRHAAERAPQVVSPMERTIALRVHGLSDEALMSIRAIVELARKGEGLDDGSEDLADR